MPLLCPLPVQQAKWQKFYKITIIIYLIKRVEVGRMPAGKTVTHEGRGARGGGKGEGGMKVRGYD